MAQTVTETGLRGSVVSRCGKLSRCRLNLVVLQLPEHSSCWRKNKSIYSFPLQTKNPGFLVSRLCFLVSARDKQGMLYADRTVRVRQPTARSFVTSRLANAEATVLS